jgi:RNA polymerase sigma-70 factor (ECF subfamily)
VFSDKNDEQLMQEVAKGSKQAFQEIYNRYDVIIYNYLDKLVFDKDYLNDIYQNVFIKVYQKSSTFKKKYKFKNWIYKIATNEFVDYIRKYKKSMKRQAPNFDVKRLSDPTSLDEIIYDKQKLDCFYQALEELQSPYKEAFVMRRIDNFNIEDSADVLNVSERTIKNYCSKAEKFIISYLRERHFD